MRILSAGLLFFSIWLASCKKDKESPSLNLDKTSITFKAEGGKEHLDIRSNTHWELTGLPEWLTANPSSGTGNTDVELTAIANGSANELKASLTLKSASGVTPATISIIMEQPEVVISSFTQHTMGGSEMVIEGSGFSHINAENIVTVNGKPATVKSSGKNSLAIIVPSKAGDGKISVKVNGKADISASDFYYDWVGTVSTPYNGKTGSVIFYPMDIISDAAGNIYVADATLNRILKIEPGKAPVILAGSGTPGFVNGNGIAASFKTPVSLTMDKAGNLYVADAGNYAIRKINTNGDVTTVAGTGVSGYNNGPVGTATFSYPRGIVIDANDNIFVTEYYGHIIRKISNGQVTTFVGSGSFGAQDGTGTAATLGYPAGIRFDADGNILLAASYNHKVRKITPAGVVTTVAGSGTMGFSDNTGNLATFQYLTGVATDPEGNIIVVDRDNNAVRRISKAGWVCTLAGKGSGLYGQTDGKGSTASFSLPDQATVTSDGTIYVADPSNQKIRKIIIE